MIKPMNKNKVVIIGVGETQDPLPEAEKPTKFWVHAGPCKKCGCAGRTIENKNNQILLICENCGNEVEISIDSRHFHEITYVYWCNQAKFATDLVKLSLEEAARLQKVFAEFEDEYEIPRWAVQIVGGRCLKSGQCVNFSCKFNKPVQ